MIEVRDAVCPSLCASPPPKFLHCFQALRTHHATQVAIRRSPDAYSSRSHHTAQVRPESGHLLVHACAPRSPQRVDKSPDVAAISDCARRAASVGDPRRRLARKALLNSRPPVSRMRVRRRRLCVCDTVLTMPVGQSGAARHAGVSLTGKACRERCICSARLGACES